MTLHFEPVVYIKHDWKRHMEDGWPLYMCSRCNTTLSEFHEAPIKLECKEKDGYYDSMAGLAG